MGGLSAGALTWARLRGGGREADGLEPLQDPEQCEEGSGYQQGQGLHPLCLVKGGSVPLCGGLWGPSTLERINEGQGLRPQKGQAALGPRRESGS